MFDTRKLHMKTLSLLWHEGKCLLRRAAEVEICELGHVLAVIPVCPSSGEW